jgi:hypothetical protein
MIELPVWSVVRLICTALCHCEPFGCLAGAQDCFAVLAMTNDSELAMKLRTVSRSISSSAGNFHLPIAENPLMALRAR